MCIRDRAKIQEMAEFYQLEVAEMRKKLTEQGSLEVLRQNVANEKTIQLLVESAVQVAPAPVEEQEAEGTEDVYKRQLYTLTEFENVDRVELRVAGHRVTTLPSGLSLPNPFSRSERPLNLEIASDITDLNQGTKVRLYFSAVGPARCV